VPTRSPRNAITVYRYWDLGFFSFFVVHFVAKRYILEQKCQKGTNRNLDARITLEQLA